jgi:hypothetical protein
MVILSQSLNNIRDCIRWRETLSVAGQFQGLKTMQPPAYPAYLHSSTSTLELDPTSLRRYAHSDNPSAMLERGAILSTIHNEEQIACTRCTALRLHTPLELALG